MASLVGRGGVLLQEGLKGAVRGIFDSFAAGVASEDGGSGFDRGCRVHNPFSNQIVGRAVDGLVLAQAMQVRVEVDVLGVAGFLYALPEHGEQNDLHDIRVLVAGNHQSTSLDLGREQVSIHRVRLDEFDLYGVLFRQLLGPNVENAAEEVILVHHEYRVNLAVSPNLRSPLESV